MMDLTVVNRDGILVVDSRDVAVMVDRRHSDLLESIRNYIDVMGKSLNGDFGSMEFFIESSYIDSIGRNLPCYLLTKLGCDMVANKMTGEKGILFTASYVKKFHDMENELNKSLTQIDILVSAALQLQAIERKQKAIAEKQLKQDVKLDKVESEVYILKGKVDIINDKEYTIMGYASMNGLKVDNKTANMLGRRSAKLSNDKRYFIGKATHPVFGQINTYHVDILKEVFEEFYGELFEEV